ncbi:arginine/serine-rich protein PNISR-like isoform X2 [Anopheles coustani]|uniref:arginine/serine-rich protein PNISR-like isoform X2 n=1 Tax=Anopheles coustani TaxID=139045 RepID=UPI002658D857|nr:arginine/serine-rich protein PNISR-like isoform X2 [Anopheles coustani]
MNTNAGPNSLGASGSGALYGGADSSAQMLQVLASSNVMPGYQNMNKDQVDWGLLAQQWIRMREWSQPVNDFVPTPPPPPSFHDTADLGVSDCGQGDGTAFDEQGEAPMEVEKEDDNLGAGSSLMLPVAAPPGHTIVDPTATAAVASWQAKMNQLYHMNLAGHQSAPITGSTFAPVNQRDGSSTESKQPPYQRRIDRDVKLMAESVGTGEPGPPVLNGGKDYGGGESVTMNEAKRKLLPAWIREGLEKMEREKQRQLEREQERRMWEEEQRRQRSAEDEALADWSPTKPETSSALRSHEEEDGTDPPNETLNHNTEEPALVTDSIEDDDEIWATFVRTTMTDILSKVTGNLIVACVTATINKSKKRKAKQVQSKQVKPGLVTCTGALGLGIYGDSDDEDEDDEEESAGKEAVSGGDSQGDESTDDDLSDSAAVQKLEETIRRKHRDFVHTARDVEQWISSVQLSPRQKPADSEGADGMQHTTVHLPGDQDDEHRAPGIGRDELAGYGGRSAASSNGDVGSKSGSARLSGSTRDGETQPVNDKLYASQQFGGRRRLEKRVSRFSELQEPRARLPLNPPPVPPVMTYKLGALSSHPSDQSASVGKGQPGDATKRAAHNPADVLLLKANQRLAQQQRQHHPAGGGVVPPAPPVLTASDVEGAHGLAVGGGSGSAEKNANRYLASLQSLAKASEPKKDGDHLGGEDKAAHKSEPKESRRSDSGRSGSRQHEQRKSHAHRERSEREQRHRQDYYHRQRSRSKSSRSYTRSPHSVSRSTRSRSSRSRSRSKSHRADHSSSARHHRHRSDRSRRHHSRSWSRSSYSSSRSTSSSRSSVSQERSRSTERRRDAPGSKLFTRRPE